MPNVKTPRRGSKGHWPRRRTNRIYPTLNTFPETDKPKIMGFAGYKASMTHAIVFDNRKGSLTFGQEISTPVTVLDCPPLKIVGLRTYKNTTDGLKVISESLVKEVPKELSRKMKVGNFKTEEKIANMEKKLGDVSKVRLIVATQPQLSGVKKKRPEVFELEIGGKDAKEKFEFAKSMLNKEFTAKDFVKEGELIDVVSVTRGQGTQGPVKRFHIRIQVRHAKKKLRHVGSLGQERPGKVRPTVPQAGQLGFFRRTEVNKRVLKIGDAGEEVTPKSGFINYGVVKGNYILLEGSVPGTNRRLIMMRPAIRPGRLKFNLPEVREVAK
ncbi:MAG: 50S ribosomal protein L3 [Candidatus Aenigmarchaeota archaeon]|nr:50S ribosomal protein L3 [Candidatus Aenigmarchaeota archaeon]